MSLMKRILGHAQEKVRSPRKVALLCLVLLPVLGSVLVAISHKAFVPWVAVFLCFYGSQLVLLRAMRQSTRVIGKKITRLERAESETKKYASTVEFRTRTYNPEDITHKVLPAVNQINDRLDDVEEALSYYQGDALPLGGRPGRYQHNRIKPFTVERLGEQGSSGRLAGSVQSDSRNMKYLNRLIYAGDPADGQAVSLGRPTVSLLQGSSLAPHFSEVADVQLLHPQQVAASLATNYLVVEASVLRQGVWEYVLNSSSTRQYISFIKRLKESARGGLIVIYVDDSPDKSHFGYDLMGQADFVVRDGEVHSTFNYWGPDSSLPVLDVIVSEWGK